MSNNNNKKLEEAPVHKPELLANEDSRFKWMDKYAITMDFLNPKTEKTEVQKATIRELIALFNNQSHRLAHTLNMLNITNSLAQVTLYELRRVDPGNEFFKKCDPKYTEMADRAIKKREEDLKGQKLIQHPGLPESRLNPKRKKPSA